MATSRSKNIFVGLSNLVIENSIFIGKSTEVYSKTDQTRGAFIYAIVLTEIEISKTEFRYGIATYGGALYITGDATIQISSSSFIQNFASDSGGAIYASGFKSL